MNLLEKIKQVRELRHYISVCSDLEEKVDSKERKRFQRIKNELTFAYANYKSEVITVQKTEKLRALAHKKYELKRKSRKSNINNVSNKGYFAKAFGFIGDSFSRLGDYIELHKELRSIGKKKKEKLDIVRESKSRLVDYFQRTRGNFDAMGDVDEIVSNENKEIYRFLNVYQLKQDDSDVEGQKILGFLEDYIKVEKDIEVEVHEENPYFGCLSAKPLAHGRTPKPYPIKGALKNPLPTPKRCLGNVA